MTIMELKTSHRMRAEAWLALFLIAIGWMAPAGAQEGVLPDLSRQLESAQAPAAESTPKEGSKAMALAKGAEALQRVEASMRQAADRMRGGTTDPTTQQLQREAVSLLDALLEKMQPSQSSSQSTASQAENDRPPDAPDPKVTPGPMQSGDQRDGQDQSTEGQQGEPQPNQQNGSPDGGSRSEGQSGNTPTGMAGPGGPTPPPALPPLEILSQGVWGHLPERARRDLRAVSPDQYLPSYRLKIEAYYRRLAEQVRE